MKDQTCACCNEGMQIRGSVSGYSEWHCTQCGYVNFVRAEGTVVPEMYEDDPDYIGDLSVAGRYSDLIQWAHRETLKYLSKSASRASVLDIGCFNGFFVAALLRDGFRARGIDFNRKAIAHGRSAYGLGDAIGTQTIAELVTAGERFDVITMFEVIEHLEEPSSVIEAAKALLKPGGLFIVSTPNSKMSWRPALDNPPHHLSRFTPASLRSLLGSHGLACESLLEQTSIFDFVRNFVGSGLRDSSNRSMRGGAFRARPVVDAIRLLANRVNPALKSLLWPVDRLLHAAGFRYISQLAIGRAAGTEEA